ncbi:hypothetical protein PspLS_02522 [Pyricularia sp. CBS 133598]|nr:hypothetical protein PspLS_02522 [Pyricularia sp. CBS 133598]
MANQDLFVLEWRDQEDRAVAQYNEVNKRRKLEQENLALKTLLREHGICWSPELKHHPEFFDGTFDHRFSSEGRKVRRRVTRAQTAAQKAVREAAENGLKLPMEILLMITEYAMVGNTPIIDPLSKPSRHNLTKAETRKGSEVAYGLLGVNRAIREEASKIMWSKNTLTFTTIDALYNMIQLPLAVRSEIKNINLRVIARYYHEKDDPVTLKKSRYPNLPRTIELPINKRPRSHKAAHGGFRSYSWLQIADFLQALLPPYDPEHSNSTKQPKRQALLLPNLDTMRIDLINFAQDLLRYIPGNCIHDIAAHELASVLSELTVTGLPCCQVGIKVGMDLSQMLRDNGLFLDASSAYIMPRGKWVVPVAGKIPMSCRVIRPRILMEMTDEDKETFDITEEGNIHYMPNIYGSHHHPHSPGYNPDPVPLPLEGPYSCENDQIWKRVPKTLGSEEREWVSFESDLGLNEDDVIWDRISDLDLDSEADLSDYHSFLDPEDKRAACRKCNKIHWDPYDSE